MRWKTGPEPGAFKWLLLVPFALTVCLAAGALGAEPASGSGPKTLLLLASGLSFDDLRPGGPLPHVRQLADVGGIALLNTAVSGEPSEAAAYLSVGGGERLAAPVARLREMARRAAGNPAETATNLAAQIASPNVDRAARALYRRRFGAWPPGAGLVHLGLPALQNVQPRKSQATQVGALGDALRAAGRRRATPGNDWRAALVLMDRRGVVAENTVPGSDPLFLLARADVAVITADDAARLDALCARVLPLVRSGSLHVLVVVPAPPRDADGKRWARLGFLVAAGPNIAPRDLLTSPTTRTPGLVANVDVAPTVLAWQDVENGRAGFAGRALTEIASPDPWAAAATLDRQVVATKNATVPVLIGYGAFAIGTGLVALVALLTRRAPAVRANRFGLLTAAGTLVALLPVGVWAPRAPLVYGAVVALVSALLAGAALRAGRAGMVSPLGLLLTLAAVVVALDAFAGSPLVSRALLSGYFLPGIRFYGVGNEYEGLGIGAALIGPVLLGPTLPRSRAAWMATIFLWVAVLIAISAPFFGADAGGAISGSVTFVLGFFALRRGERGLRRRHVACAFAVAALAILSVALLDRARPPQSRTHTGAAVAAGQTRGAGALAEIIVRKVAMNAGLLLTPGAFGALAGLAPIWWLLSRGRLGAQTRAALSARPGLARALPASGWGALAAFVFNDSGIVAALLLLAPPTAAVIDACLCDSSAWTTEPNGSGLP